VDGSPDIAVSVVLSTHNRAHFLPDALASLAAQDCRVPFEVVVIDNASTDDTARLLDTWRRQDRRFRTGFEARLGLSCGKNAGIRLARAPLLLFTDDDTIADSRWVQSYVDLFAARPDELMLAGGPQIPIPDDLGPWPDWFDEPALADIAMLDYGEDRTLNRHEYVWGANMAVSRRLFERFGVWDETVGRKGHERGTFEDTEFQDRVRAARGVVRFCPGAIVHHRVPRETITPRQISSTAFTRGRNDVWRTNIPIWREPRLVPKRNLILGLLILGAALARWSLWIAAFRLLRTRRVFERARRAAFSAGQSLDTLRAGRDSVDIYLAVSRAAFHIRALLLRMSPDTAQLSGPRPAP
jgi:GT2 family glycosyltransferase